MLRADRNNSYLELRKFLEDVYIYLNNQITERIDESATTEQEPTDLIARCKDILNAYEIEHDSQLEQAYLEMNGNNKFDQPCEYVDVTSPVAVDAVDVSTNESMMEIKGDEQANVEPKVNHVTETPVVCPFGGLPAAHLTMKKSPKVGSLRIKDKTFKFNRMKYYSGLLDGWLLMYSNSCDLKPTICLNLQNYDLCNSDSYRRREQFELISNECKTDKPKRYLLQAASANDYEEWQQAIMAAANPSQIRTRLNSITRKLPSPPPFCDSESIPRLSDRISEGIYEEPSEMFSTQSYPSFQFDSWTQLPLAPALPVKISGSKIKIECNAESVGYDVPKSPPKPTAPDLDHQHKIQQVKSQLSQMQMLSPKQFTKSPSAEKPSCADEDKLKEKSKKKSKVEASSELPKFSKRNWFLNRLSGRNVTNSSKLKMEMENVRDDVHVSYDPVESRLDGKRGGKVNMIINQLEANGHFPLRREKFKESRLSKYSISNVVDDEECHNYELMTITGRNAK